MLLLSEPIEIEGEVYKNIGKYVQSAIRNDL